MEYIYIFNAVTDCGLATQNMDRGIGSYGIATFGFKGPVAPFTNMV